MKISYNWLSDYIDHGLTPHALGELLTSIGLEVEEITHFRKGPKYLDGLVTGKVLSAEQHPNADRLRVTKVDVGHETPLNIVCGAPNVAAGQKVVVALVGTQLHPLGGEAFTIKKSKIRGEESEGMICAEDEIGIGTDHSGIIILPAKTEVGIPYKDVLNPYEDWVIEIGLTPNRVDAACHIGVARDLASALGKKLKHPQIPRYIDCETGDNVTVEVMDGEACPRYSGFPMVYVEVKESPDWLKNRLEAVGLNPINNIVDVTNFVLYEMGHPLHAFDVAKIKGRKIIVRRSVPGEEMVTLDKQNRKMNGSELLICNEEEPMAIAGVFGGLDSGITSETKSIFLEGACFNPATIRHSAKRHGLSTDASFRFERGTDINLTLRALARAYNMIKEVAGGKIVGDLQDFYPVFKDKQEIRLDYDFLYKIAGDYIPAEEVKRILLGMEMEILEEDDAGIKVNIPGVKVDVTRPIDLVEEIMRIYSFDKINFSPRIKSILQVDKYKSKENIVSKISGFLAAQGFSEAFHLSFVNPHENIGDGSESVKVLNPLSTDLEAIRNNMLRPGLKSLAHNLNRKQPDVRLFEWGSTYHAKGEGYTQKYFLSLWITGNQTAGNWVLPAAKADYYYLKSIAEQVLALAGIKKYVTSESSDNDLDFQLTYSFEDKEFMRLGKVADSALKLADINKPVYYAEFNTPALVEGGGEAITYQAVSRFPKVERDLSLTVPVALKYEDIKERILKNGDVILTEVSIFDVYQGEQVKQGFKSYSIRMEFEDKHQTLEDKRIDKIMRRIIDSLEKELNVTIRQ